MARRPNWSEGEWIELANGQRWSFPRLMVRLICEPEPARVWFTGEDPDPEAGADLERVLSILAAKPEAATTDDVFQEAGKLADRMVPIAAVFLRRNYAISDEQAAWLLRGGFFELPETAAVVRMTEALLRFNLVVLSLAGESNYDVLRDVVRLN